MTPDNSSIKLFAGTDNDAFVDKMCAHLGITKGLGYARKYPEGNTFVKIEEKVRGKNVYLVKSIAVAPNDDFMELLFWIDAFKRASVKSVTAIIPYFSYAKGDKKDEPRVSIRARVCADCLEEIGVDRIITMDLHSPQIQGFFKKPVDHLSAIPVLSAHIKSMHLENMMVFSPDAGFAKNVRLYAGILNTPLAIGDKVHRFNDENAEVLEIFGDVKGKNVFIVDDFSITCNTLISAAEKLKDQGAERIFACVTHAMMSEKGITSLENSAIEKLLVTDTVKNDRLIGHPKIEVVSVAQIFADAVSTIQNEESLGALLDKYNSQ
ncbi:ribose-phosphate diphosphokinase [bacterium]|nr:ribose-phosphate diphosphokinase [bacterium]